MKRLLLSYKFKYWGLLMFPLGLIGWFLTQTGVLTPLLDTLNIRYPGLQILTILFFFSFLFGLYFLVFAREKNEDEFITKLRLESFQFAFIMQFIFFLCSFLYMLIFRNEPGDDSVFILFFILSAFVLWVSYIIRFNLILVRNKFKAENEE